MRGAGQESSAALLEHVERRLTRRAHEAAALADEAPGDGRLWGLSVDLSALGDVVAVLLDRARFPQP
jgi:hypothetical protein